MVTDFGACDVIFGIILATSQRDKLSLFSFY